MGRSQLWWSRALGVALVAVAMLAASSVAVLVIAGAPGGRVARHVVVAGTPVGGLDAAALRERLGRLDRQWQATPVVLVAEDRRLGATAGELGVRVDVAATARAALAVGRRGGPVPRLTSAAGRVLGHHRVVPVLTLDRAALDATLDRLDAGGEPLEPVVMLSDGEFVALPGRPARRVDATAVAAALPAAVLAHRGGAPQVAGPLLVGVPLVTVRPSLPDDAAAVTAAKANEVSAAGLTVEVAGRAVPVAPADARTWLVPDVAARDVRVDPQRMAGTLARLVPEPVTPPRPPSVAVVEGRLVPRPGTDGERCCAPPPDPAGVLVAMAFRQPVSLPLTVAPTAPPPDLERIGIVEEVARFTTRHPAGEPRVRNIHLAADLLKGRIIAPGETLSLNAVLGPRTRARGFVDAPSIVAGRLQPRPGGGVSQLATTLFNAAFFAGLEIPEYQSHSIYISRYPYGREATIDWPAIDLKVTNTKPTSVLVWVDYTASDVTVSLWSTRQFANVEQGAQQRRRAGACTEVRTERVRTYLDGRRVVDEFAARYRPGEGLGC